jgi:hypothetical protein
MMLALAQDIMRAHAATDTTTMFALLSENLALKVWSGHGGMEAI